MRKSIIVEHIEDYWFFYVAVAALMLMFTGIVIAVNKSEQWAEACLERGMILVDTDAGGRCAAPNSLERI